MESKYKVDILAIGVHPDDIELGCGGTILKHIELGYKVAVVDLTRGELGSRGTISTRKEEASDAMNFASIHYRENLSMEDGFFSLSTKEKLKLIKAIRKFRPDIVLGNAESDRHPDHGRASQLIYEACFLAGLKKVETTDAGELQSPWRPRKLLHYIQDHYIKPDIIVDISGFMDRKIELVQCYKTQFYNPNQKGPQTPISSLQFLESLKARALDYGRRIGVEYGEGFTCREYVGVQNLNHIL